MRTCTNNFHLITLARAPGKEERGAKKSTFFQKKKKGGILELEDMKRKKKTENTNGWN